MIRKSGNRFSEKDPASPLKHDPEEWSPVFRKDHASPLKHDPEKWSPVFRKRSCFTKKIGLPIDSI
jgi:hypothetical protein